MQPTAPQAQLAISVAAIDTHDEDPILNTGHIGTTAVTRKAKSYGHKLIIHYTHEKRFQSFKKDMHTIYEDVFKDTPAMQVKLIVGNKNRRSARQQLIRKKPSKTLLQNKPPK
ncbi:unnamed protein product, partial [Didymodactylos carnosus]